MLLVSLPNACCIHYSLTHIENIILCLKGLTLISVNFFPSHPSV